MRLLRFFPVVTLLALIFLPAHQAFADKKEKAQSEPQITVAEAESKLRGLTKRLEELRPEVVKLRSAVTKASTRMKASKSAEDKAAFNKLRNATRSNPTVKEFESLRKEINKLKGVVRQHYAKEHWKNVVEKRADGLLVVKPVPVDEKFNNPWPKEQEEWFIKHYNETLRHHAETPDRSVYFNTFFENEKQGYGVFMGKFLADGGTSHLATLQQEDVDGWRWHKHTLGIDWYACFTIKHQVRKYFLFGDGLAPDYKQRMFDSAKIWTEKDPLRRPHYAYQGGGGSWGPDNKNSWVDVRQTDNLKLMRDTSVYLMAEETGNKETTEKYKGKIRDFVVTLYRVGNGEWDSRPYLEHALAPLHNLYDFSKDPEVKLLAKAALDWYYTAAARKYWRGGWTGPQKRDYNSPGQMGGSAKAFSVMFGGNQGMRPKKLKGDEMYPLSSAYRPPMAVINFARREFKLPATLLTAYPHYTAAIKGEWNKAPSFFETSYFAENYQFGTLAGGTQESDANGFSILVADNEKGSELIGMVPGPDPNYVGSPGYQQGKLVGKSRVAQYENSAVYLNNVGDAPWSWRFPLKTELEMAKGIMFAKTDKVWMAFLPINSKIKGYDEALTDKVRYQYKKRIVQSKHKAKPPKWLKEATEIKKDEEGKEYVIEKRKGKGFNYQAASAVGSGGDFCGIAIELGDQASHGSYEKFKSAILQKAKVDASKLTAGQVVFTDSRGRTIDLTFGKNLTESKFLLNGTEKKFTQPWMKYSNADGSIAPLSQAWGGGTLYVEAGGEAFACTVSEDGKVKFSNGKPAEVRKFAGDGLEPRMIDVPGGAPVISDTPIGLDFLPQGTDVFVVRSPEKKGTRAFLVSSDYQKGPNVVEVLLPDGYKDVGGKRYPVIYTLPVNTGTQGKWGCALQELQKADMHNKLQAIVVAPAYDLDPWMGDLPSKPGKGNWIRQRSYLTDIVVPMIDSQFSTIAEPDGRSLIGFSKSGPSAVSILLDHPEVFGNVGVYDNAEPDLSDERFDTWGLVNVYGDRDNYQASSPLRLVTKKGAGLKGKAPRILVWSGNEEYEGVNALKRSLREEGVPFEEKTMQGMGHSWRDPWLPQMAQALQPAS